VYIAMGFVNLVGNCMFMHVQKVISGRDFLISSFDSFNMGEIMLTIII